ncbi:MAG: heavy-metal-associated domain-containing protein [Clostridia bacterium]|nr:heavy-metal-associated domain-containing protein [Clostridia bacterium]
MNSTLPAQGVNILILILLAALFCWAVYAAVRKARRGGGCCGEHEETEAKTSVKDRKKAHYPYELSIKIGGMTCENCARKVENALNSLDGVWATVSIDSHTARIRSKSVPNEQALRQAVRNAGYIPMD